MHIRVRVDQPGKPAQTLDVAGDAVRFGRSKECEVAVDPVAYPKVSGVHARIESDDSGLRIGPDESE